MTKVKLKRLSFGGITKTPDNSWSWRNLLKLRNVAKSVVVYKLGNGKRSHSGLIHGVMDTLL